MYSLFVDKNDEFSCKISVEGADIKSTVPRLFIQTDQWGLIFEGKIENGTCRVPLKKLKSIINEGDSGTIKLEVIADDTLLVPWESAFEAKVSKKITINEVSNTHIKVDNKPKITVDAVSNTTPNKTFASILKEHNINLSNIDKNSKKTTYLFENYLKTLNKKQTKFLLENKSIFITNILKTLK